MKNQIPVLIVLFCLIGTFKGFSQTLTADTISTKNSGDTGTLTIVQDPIIDYLLAKHIEGSIEKKIVSGYRIQLIANSDKQKVIGMKTSFITEYPDVKVYMTYFQPNYRLRAGDFKTRIEANQFLKKLLKDFPGAWVVNDTIVIIENEDEN